MSEISRPFLLTFELTFFMRRENALVWSRTSCSHAIANLPHSSLLFSFHHEVAICRITLIHPPKVLLSLLAMLSSFTLSFIMSRNLSHYMNLSCHNYRLTSIDDSYCFL
ncbi:hypothetical protein ABZP36_019293 [Zizania latifolia]